MMRGWFVWAAARCAFSRIYLQDALEAPLDLGEAVRPLLPV